MPNTFKVVCDICDEVTFDVREENEFASEAAAHWFAGYHVGTEHPSSTDGDVATVTAYPSLEGDAQSTAEALAEMTGRERSNFESDHPLPNPEELLCHDADEFYNQEEK